MKSRRPMAGAPAAARIALAVVVAGAGVGAASLSAGASARQPQPRVPIANRVDTEATTASTRLATTSRLPHAGRPEALAHPDADHAGLQSAATGRLSPSVRPAAAQTSAGSINGLDVSSYQGNVDWAQVATNGAQFAYAKASEGTSYTSPYFDQQYQGAAGHGLIRGAYHFAIPDNSAGAAQADFFAAHGGSWSADNHTLPGMVDLEYNPYGAECYGLSSEQMVSWVSSFVNEYHADTGRWAVIYTTTDWWSTCTGNSAAFAGLDPLWIANYSASPDPLPAGWATYDFWQYADSGVLPGDQDVFNGSAAQLLAVADDNPVTSYYAQLGGSTSYLGTPTDSPYPAAGGEAQDFTGGSIYWSAGTGAHAVHGAILSHYQALGGPGGFLGFPATDEAGTPDGVGRFNHFANDGSIYWTPSTGAWSVRGAIYDHWAAMGWETGPLGYPVTDEAGTPDGVGRFNHFANDGSIYWTPSTGAWSVRGAIYDHWAAMGWETGPLGYPVTDEAGTPDGVGRFNHFANDGSIYWTPSTGAWSVRGAIYDHWAAMGWETGPLGYPVTDEAGTPDGVGRFNHFANDGSIYWTPSTGAWSVHGAIQDLWAALGWERSFLGYPTSDEYAIPVGRQNNFVSGIISWNATTGVTTTG